MKSRSSKPQIVAILMAAAAGVMVAEFVRKPGIWTNTYFNWK